jgi:hypothetical protein
VSVVARGLGLPEEGSLVAFGLGRSTLVGGDVLIPAVTVAGAVIIPGIAVSVPQLRDGSPWGSVPITPIFTTPTATPPAHSTVAPATLSTGQAQDPYDAATPARVAVSAVARAGGTSSQVASTAHGSRLQRLPLDSRVDTETPTSEVGT